MTNTSTDINVIRKDEYSTVTVKNPVVYRTTVRCSLVDPEQSQQMITLRDDGGSSPAVLTLFPNHLAALLDWPELADAAHHDDDEEVSVLMRENRESIREAIRGALVDVIGVERERDYYAPRIVDGLEVTSYKAIEPRLTMLDTEAVTFTPRKAEKVSVTDAALSEAKKEVERLKAEAEAEIVRLEGEIARASLEKRLADLRSQLAPAPKKKVVRRKVKGGAK